MRRIVSILLVAVFLGGGIYTYRMVRKHSEAIPFDSVQWKTTIAGRRNMSDALLVELKAMQKTPSARTLVLAKLGPPDSEALSQKETLGAIFRYRMHRAGETFELMKTEYYLIIVFNADDTISSYFVGVD